MRRRKFLGVLGGTVAAWPLTARAQQGEQQRRIAVLLGYSESDPVYRASLVAFQNELQKRGWTEGRNIHSDTRMAVDLDHLRAYAAEIVAQAPDVIFTSPSGPLVPLQRATRTVPIVFANILDPIANGFVASLARPSGNITGFAQNEQAIAAKRLELLKEIAPRIVRVVFVYDPVNPAWSGAFAELEAKAASFGVQVSRQPVHSTAEIEHAISAFAREPNGGLLMQAGGLITSHRKEIASLAARHALPAVYSFRHYVADGGLASYGINVDEQFRGAASYVDRILKGEHPGDLPVQFATKFEVIINLKAAKALGLDPPIALLARTDEVIE